MKFNLKLHMNTHNRALLDDARHLCGFPYNVIFYDPEFALDRKNSHSYLKHAWQCMLSSPQESRALQLLHAVV